MKITWHPAWHRVSAQSASALSDAAPQLNLLSPWTCRPLFKFAIAVFPQKSVQCVFHMCGDKMMAFALSLVPSSDSGGRVDQAHLTSQRRGQWGCVLLPSPPHHLAPLSTQRVRLVISPFADPRTVIALFHPQPNSTPFTFLPLN